MRRHVLTMPRPGYTRRLVAVAAVGLVVVATVLGAFVLSRPPLGPSPAAPSAPARPLAAAALTRCGATALGLSSGATEIVDQRGALAALLFVDRPNAVVCLLTIDGTGTITSASSGATHLDPLVGPILSSSGIAAPASEDFAGVTVVVGQVASAVAAVHVTAAAPWVSATVKDGFFLAWWPSDERATDIEALDHGGRIVGHARDPNVGR